MSSPTSVRKSGRQRVPNKKYTVDAFEGLDILNSESEHDTELLQQIEARAARDDRDGQDEFSQDNAFVSERAAEEDDQMSAAEGSENSAVATPNDSDEEVIAISAVQSSGGGSMKKRSQPLIQDEDVHFRGMTESRIRAARGNDQLFVEQVIGSDSKELALFRQTRDKWASVISLPTKQCNNHGRGGMDYLFNHPAHQRDLEATVGWDWYFVEGGKTTFQGKQILEALTVDVGAKYVSRPSRSSQSLLMGPYGKQHSISIPFMQSMSLDESWRIARMNHPSNSDNHNQSTPSKRQYGWVLNLGISVRCLEWVPNHPGRTQYLAISTLPPMRSGEDEPPQSAPAYTASSPTPSCIQIWAVTRLADSGNIVHQAPQLRMVICTEWGHAKQLKWCPMPKHARSDESDAGVHLGLLAGIWNDGYVRVLDIHLDHWQGSNTTYVKYKTAAFEARPPDTLCTCVTWLSPTNIAVGCANGYLALWDIFPRKPVVYLHRPAPRPFELSEAEALESMQRTNSSNTSINAASPVPRPYLYMPIHHSYILAVANAYPPYPHFLCTSSISGHTRLTDIRSPISDSVFAPHTRFGPSSIVYSAHMNCFLTTHEDGKFIHAWPLRRFWAYVGLARGESELLSLCTSAFHPTILGGYADGTLLAFNPLRRYLGEKVRQGQPQQKVWKHEWARTTQIGEYDPARREGISRITEGYKIDIAALAPEHDRRTRVSRKPASGEDNAPISTIYEEESGVRVVSWNPNLEWGGWAASGMGNGLVRVEDLAI